MTDARLVLLLLISSLSACSNWQAQQPDGSYRAYSLERQTAPAAAPNYQNNGEHCTIGTKKSAGNPKVYKVLGRWYQLRDSACGYSATGLASWYGPGFHGKRTSNGELYDMHAMTGAHKTLPIPVMVRVTNLENGRQIKVRINDRGPFHQGRIIDLSKVAAQQLDMLGKGTAQVKVEVIDPQSPPTAIAATSVAAAQQPPASTTARAWPAPPAIKVVNNMPAELLAEDGSLEPPVIANSKLYIQIGSFADLQNASSLRDKLLREGFSSAKLYAVNVNGASLQRLRLGAFTGVAASEFIAAKLQKLGYSNFQIISE